MNSILQNVFWVDAFAQVCRDGFETVSISQFVILYFVHLVWESEAQHDSSKEHLNAQDEILVACRYSTSLDCVVFGDKTAFRNDRKHKT